MWRTPAVPAKWNATAETQTTSTIFQINIASLYLPVVNLSINANMNFVMLMYNLIEYS